MAVVSDLAVPGFGQAGDPAAPPPVLFVQPALGVQNVALTMAAGPTIAAPAEIVPADSLVLDSAATLPLPVATPEIAIAAILVEGAHTEAAAIIQSANILADLAQPTVVTPSSALTGLVDHGQHVVIGAPAAQSTSAVASGHAAGAPGRIRLRRPHRRR